MAKTAGCVQDSTLALLFNELPDLAVSAASAASLSYSSAKSVIRMLCCGAGIAAASWRSGTWLTPCRSSWEGLRDKGDAGPFCISSQRSKPAVDRGIGIAGRSTVLEGSALWSGRAYRANLDGVAPARRLFCFDEHLGSKPAFCRSVGTTRREPCTPPRSPAPILEGSAS